MERSESIKKRRAEGGEYRFHAVLGSNVVRRSLIYRYQVCFFCFFRYAGRFYVQLKNFFFKKIIDGFLLMKRMKRRCRKHERV